MKRAIVLLIILACAAGAWYAFEQPPVATIFTAVETHPVRAAMAFAAVYFIVAGLSIPSATFFSLLGGALFGTIAGAVLVNIGATLGAAGAFLISRYLFRDWVQGKYKRHLQHLNKEMRTHGANYLLFVRLVPVFPFFVINLLAGLTPVSLATFLWTTSVGILPVSLIYTYAGSSAGTAITTGALSPQLIFALVLLGIASLAPVIYKKIRRKQKA